MRCRDKIHRTGAWSRKTASMLNRITTRAQGSGADQLEISSAYNLRDANHSRPTEEAFLLITPDAIARHATFEILRRLHEAGFQVTRFRVHHKPPQDIERFHARNAYVKADPQLHAMARELLSLGPSLALLLAADAAAGTGDVFTRLSALKGFGDPRYALPGSIRRDLRSINVLLNLVHAAVDEEELIRDREVFLGEPTENAFGGLLQAAIDELHRRVPHEARDLTAVLAAVRQRAPAIDAYLSEDAQDPADVAAGMAYVRRSGVELDRWARLLLRTSIRFPMSLDTSDRRLRVAHDPGGEDGQLDRPGLRGTYTSSHSSPAFTTSAPPPAPATAQQVNVA